MANHLEVLLNAAKLLEERGNDTIHFLLVGDGPERRRLQGIAAGEGLTDVTFLPPAGKTYVPSLFGRCGVDALRLVQPALYRYGISANKAFDYMAAGLPIAMTGTARGNPVVDSGCGVVLDSDHIVGLAGVLEKWASNPQCARELGRRGRDFVAHKHSTARLATVLNGLLSTNG